MSRTKKQTRKQFSLHAHVFTSLVKRAFREHSLLAAGGPGFVAMVTPKGYALSEFQKHVVDELYGDDPFFRRDDIHLAFMKLQGNQSDIMDDYTTHFQTKLRVVILLEHGVEVPPLINLACDGVIEIAPIKAIDLKAASMAVLRKPMSDEQAAALLSYPREYLWAALRDGRSPGNALQRLRNTTIPAQQNEAATDSSDHQSDGPRLSEMHGYGPAKDWGLELSQDIRDWKAGSITWNEIDRGILLSGPPGVGKTIFAKALAKECEAHLIASSLGKWQSEGHLGDLLKAMRKDFKNARLHSPCILFIDEIDAFGSRDAFSNDNKNYSVQVVNAFLEFLDGIDGREGVIIVGASNNVDGIDPAILRSGRLDRHVDIPLPSLAERVAILSQLIQGILPVTHLDLIGPSTQGMTGADLAKAVRDAKRLARRNRRQLTLEDLKASLPPTFKIVGEHRRSIAIHEAGHTLVGLKLRTGRFLGSFIADQIVVDSATQQGGGAYFENPRYGRRDRQFFLDQIALLLAGIAAEKICFGDISEGAGGEKSSDLASATRIATLMETSMGMGVSLAYSPVKEDSELDEVRRTDPAVTAAVSDTLTQQFERAIDTLTQHRSLLNLVADALDENGYFTPQAAHELFQTIRDDAQSLT
ncbi:ATP-dependent zinc metalloprotease FtsH [Agrobacterium sp. DSM 25558]|uniref:AAA family ATPase n=1 Tax=Agrobacterium sp. DSM 25558 TaxID=1907665 RepID=UPI0009725A70|nr:AAA family ATPase [Agrobacterium sp. DSM 25558]SCX31372.1 ATP-dependent zinc metalloprotease FtsH [Agrobacterium sp. DSM 25558]